MGREEFIVIDGENISIPIKVFQQDGEHIITVDGVEWVRTNNMVHAAVLFNMMKDNLDKYMEFTK